MRPKHQAGNNLEPDQLTNACAGRRVRKRHKTSPGNDTCDSNHVFIRGPTTKSQPGKQLMTMY